MLVRQDPEFGQESSPAGDDDARNVELVDDLQGLEAAFRSECPEILDFVIAEDLRQLKGDDFNESRQRQAGAIGIAAVDGAVHAILTGEKSHTQPAAVDLEQCAQR